MKFKSIAIMALLTAPSSFAMHHGYDYAQAVCPPKVSLRGDEQQRQNQAVSILGDAFSQLPNNKQQSEKEKQDFHNKIRTCMPNDAQELIGEFLAKKNHAFIDARNKVENENLKKLIPCVIERHNFYPSMYKLVW